VTAPVGVPLDEVTVAVRVTLWPAVAGLGEADSVVVVAAGPGVEPPAEFEEPPHPARRVETRRRPAGRVRRMGRSFKSL
jgi:hypothetical protein